MDLNDPALREDLDRAIFHALFTAGASFESAATVPGVRDAVLALLRERVKGDAKPAGNSAPKVCEAFAWIGQSFAHCDSCGQPYWEHTHIWGCGPAHRGASTDQRGRCRAHSRQVGASP